MLHSEIPLLRILLPLAAGIITGLYITPDLKGFITLGTSSAILLLISVFFNNNIRNYWYGPAVSFALFVCGISIYTQEKSSISILDNRETTFQGIITDYPVEKENTWMLTVKLESEFAGAESRDAGGSMVIYVRKEMPVENIMPGDNILFRCIPLPVVNRGNPNEFDYRFYMERRHIRYFAFAGKEDILSIKAPVKRKMRQSALIIRQKMIMKYMERGISGNRLGITAAITLGEKDLLEPEVRNKFIEAGVIHIMAVSGLHVGILSIFVFNILFFTGRRFAPIRVLITIAVLWAFAFITGLAAPVLRATIMFSFLQAGKLMKRPVNSINLVLASAIIIMIIRPSVIFDSGFLLSYSAVLGIIGFYRDLYTKVSFRNRIADKIWQMVAVTLIAQAATLPLTIMIFNRFPIYFIVSNIIIVPLASLIVISGCLVWITYPVSPVSGFLTSILNRLTGLTEFIAGKTASLPYSTLENIGMTYAECLVLTISIAVTLHYLLKNPRINVKYSLALFIIFTLLLSGRHIANGRTDELIVYNTQGFSTIGIRKGNILKIYTSSDTIPAEVTRHSSAGGLVNEYNRLDDKPLIMRTGRTEIMICDSLGDINFSSGKANYVILTGTRPYISREISTNNCKDLVLIAAESSGMFSSPPDHKPLLSKGTWNVRESGAYRCRLDNN